MRNNDADVVILYVYMFKRSGKIDKDRQKENLSTLLKEITSVKTVISHIITQLYLSIKYLKMQFPSLQLKYRA